MAKRVGIIDASKTFSMLLFLLLRRMGYEVALYSNMEQLEKEDLSQLDLLFVGDKIPGFTTIQALKKISSLNESSISLVVASTYSDKNVISEAKHAGAAGYILKPIQVNDLHKAIVDHVEFSSGKRKNLRSSISLKTSATINGTTSDISIYSLSKMGLLLGTGAPLPTGTAVEVNLPVVGIDRLVCGSVIYNKLNSFGIHSGSALLLTGLTSQERNAIDDFLVGDLMISAGMSVPQEQKVAASFMLGQAAKLA